jgi:hypothetical protein
VTAVISPVRQYLALRAGRRFQDRYHGDQILHAFQEKDQQRAWADVLNHEAEAAKLNVVTAARPWSGSRASCSGRRSNSSEHPLRPISFCISPKVARELGLLLLAASDLAERGAAMEQAEKASFAKNGG